MPDSEKLIDMTKIKPMPITTCLWRWWRTTTWTWCRGKWMPAPSLTFSTNSLPSLRQVLRAFQLRWQNGNHDDHGHGDNYVVGDENILLGCSTEKKFYLWWRPIKYIWIKEIGEATAVEQNLENQVKIMKYVFRRSHCPRRTYGRYRRTVKRRIITTWVS